ncbi:hypothetical protein B0T21DRAFT_410642 [Apiosordaria backusii]|uniref:Uncharacterized protein n=1 Tax=Apiosordaria backusii TaxID=314023 RepID=A0AA40BMX1_9PEZI|nr:hypothetical protein B0T21DRAFT_410642 [Apiosordaria backusii]
MAQTDHAPATTLVLANSDHFIHDTSSNPPNPIYSFNTSIDSLTYQDSSLYFNRVLTSNLTNLTNSESSSTLETNPSIGDKQENRLFNLVHPVNADYRTDIPAHYFLTCHSPSLSSIGNIKLTTSKSLLSRQVDKFKAFHYPNRTASTSPLFPDEDSNNNSNEEKVLFTATRQTFGRGYIWTNSHNKEVAREEEHKDGEVVKGRKLIFTATTGISKEEQDAVVALWVLKRWAEVAEERGFKKEVLENLSPAERAHMDMKWFKRAGALGGLAAAGGAC